MDVAEQRARTIKIDGNRLTPIIEGPEILVALMKLIDEEDETEELASLSDAAEALRLTAAAPPRPTPSGGDYE